MSRIATTEDFSDQGKEQYILDEGKRTDILVELHGKIQIYHTFDTFKDALRATQCERYIPMQLNYVT